MGVSLATDDSGLPIVSVKPTQAANRWFFAALGAVALASTGHLLIKLGLNSAVAGTATGLVMRIAHFLSQPWVITGLTIYAAGTVLWIYAVSHRQISMLYPLTALTYAIVAVGGKVLFGEMISTGRWLGICVVVIGVAMLQFSNREAGQ